MYVISGIPKIHAIPHIKEHHLIDYSTAARKIQVLCKKFFLYWYNFTKGGRKYFGIGKLLYKFFHKIYKGAK